MASIFGHALTAYTVKRFSQNPLFNARFTFLVLVSSIVPDIDVLAFKFGIAYGDLWGHRGLTHSILFAILWSFAMVLLLQQIYWQKKIKIISTTSLVACLIIFLATISHGLLDALTNGGLGIAFFSPFDTTRYFLPWQPIQVSPIGATAFFSQAGLRVIISELMLIGLACFIILSSILIKRRLKT